jgi:hypothetical protein
VAISQITFEKGRLQINPGFYIDRERWLGVGRDRFPIENVRAVLDQHVDHVRVQEYSMMAMSAVTPAPRK